MEIFISYAREDRPHAVRLAAALKAHGWEVWWDRLIRTGTNFDRVIEQQLERATCVVVLWSRAALDSDWVRAEAGYAKDHGKYFPVFVEAGIEPPLQYRQIQTESLVGWRGDPGDVTLLPLIADLEEVLGVPGRPPEGPAAAPVTGAGGEEGTGPPGPSQSKVKPTSRPKAKPKQASARKLEPKQGTTAVRGISPSEISTSSNLESGASLPPRQWLLLAGIFLAVSALESVVRFQWNWVAGTPSVNPDVVWYFVALCLVLAGVVVFQRRLPGLRCLAVMVIFMALGPLFVFLELLFYLPILSALSSGILLAGLAIITFAGEVSTFRQVGLLIALSFLGNKLGNWCAGVLVESMFPWIVMASAIVLIGWILRTDQSLDLPTLPRGTASFSGGLGNRWTLRFALTGLAVAASDNLLDRVFLLSGGFHQRTAEMVLAIFSVTLWIWIVVILLGGWAIDLFGFWKPAVIGLLAFSAATWFVPLASMPLAMSGLGLATLGGAIWTVGLYGIACRWANVGDTLWPIFVILLTRRLGVLVSQSETDSLIDLFGLFTTPMFAFVAWLALPLMWGLVDALRRRDGSDALLT